MRHPNGEDLGLSVGEGQDGSETYWGRLESRTIVVRRYPDRNRILVDVSPDDGLFLTTPHRGGPVQLHRFPDGDVVSALRPEQLLAEDDEFDFFGGFVDAEAVVLTSKERDSIFLASAKDLRHWSEVHAPSPRAGETLLVDHGLCLKSGWVDGKFEVWELARPARG